MNLKRIFIKAVWLGTMWITLSLITPCFAQTETYNEWDIADEDTIEFCYRRGRVQEIPGSVFKAINPKYIANKYGLTQSESFYWDDTEVERIKEISKQFSLVEFNYDKPNYDWGKSNPTSLTAQKKWNYYINDFRLANESRALVSALMPQAIERIIFNAADTVDRLSLEPNDSYFSYKSQGSVRFYTRDISKSIINDSVTAYILNEDLIITRKIYEAINPVFIRSLTRITDKEEIKKYRVKKGTTEIVKIDLFTHREVLSREGEVVLSINDCPECNINIVDNVEVDDHVFGVLNKSFFKRISKITEEDEEAFKPYRNKFPRKKLFGFKSVTIVTL